MQLIILGSVLFYTASVAFYVWTKEYCIKQYVKHARRTYIIKNSDVRYHWTDYAAMLYPFINISFSLVNLFHAMLYKHNRINTLRRFGA